MKTIKCFLAIILFNFLGLQGSGYKITYSPEEINEHKKRCVSQMVSNASYHQDPTYQMRRAILTISASDCDYIPKVAGAGEIVGTEYPAYQLMHNGIKIITNCYYDVQWMTDVIHGLKGHHEPQEEKCFYEILKHIPDNATMIELGSYWGYYSLWFATEVKNAKNYLIEPDEKRLEIGKKNFELNNKTATFIRGFAGRMYDCEPNALGARYISLDEFLDQEKIEHVNILHADIQFAEFEMLGTTINHLNTIDYFFISTHSDQIHKQCLDFFKYHNFAIVAEHSVSESCSADGLIVAKRNGVAGPDHIQIGKYKR
jgi:hypothetical protein